MARAALPGKVTMAALIFSALAVVAPFSLRGVACGHDLTFHMDSWMEVAQQWRQGIVFPRWAAFANYGSGEPRFLFYPPVSWILGGALGIFIPWRFVPAAFDACAVMLAGLATHAMAREWFDEPDATLIAVAYAVNPYMLLTIYVRSAFGELLAASFFPLLVLWIARNRPARRLLVPLALTIAGLWLTNVPAAIIAMYVTVLLLVIATILRRNLRVFAYGVGAIGLGLALAAFYIVPVLHEKNWITWGQLLSAGVRPAENFLFTRIGEPEHDAFLRRLSWLAAGEIAVTVLAIMAARRLRQEHRRLWWSLTLPFLAALVLMLPMSALAYRLMPDLAFVQFPWRWLLVTSVAYAVFVVALAPRFGAKASLFIPLLVGLIAACNLTLQPPCDPEDTPAMIADVYHSGYGYMGTDEYVPAGGDNYEIKPDFPDYVIRGQKSEAAPAGAQVKNFHEATYRKQMSVDSPQPAEIMLRLMNYPAWRVTVNGKTGVAQSDDPTGRMVVAVPAGRSDVDVRFVRTGDRWLGDGISLAGILFLVGMGYLGRRLSSRQPVL